MEKAITNFRRAWWLYTFGFLRAIVIFIVFLAIAIPISAVAGFLFATGLIFPLIILGGAIYLVVMIIYALTKKYVERKERNSIWN